jgi:hypothetical protein
MGEQLVRRSWTRRGLLFSAHAVRAIAAGTAVAVAAPAAVAHTELKLADLESPETVSTWLRQHGNKADRSMAKRMFDIGALARDQRNNWGPAYKGFAESALIFPAPEALAEYANAMTGGATRPDSSPTLRTSGRNRRPAGDFGPAPEWPPLLY